MTDIKENFCGACAAIPLALAGVGLSGASLKKTTTEEQKQKKRILLIVGISITIISLIVGIYYLLKCKDCR